MTDAPQTLARSLSTLHLWGIAVGLVISGEYFGWNYGWATAGTLGFLVTTLFVAAMYAAFLFGFTELTAAMPHAGGPFEFARRAFGPAGGALAGAATLVEFVFATPAIALAIGTYLSVQFPAVDPKLAATTAFALFLLLNAAGVRIAAGFELAVTLLAVFELMVFVGVVSPAFSVASFVAGGWSGQDVFGLGALPGMIAAIPFAIWFFLAIEGVAMAAEEARDPRRAIPIAYLGGIATLTVLAIAVMVAAGGSGDWRELADINDPLPRAMQRVVGADSGWVHMLVALGLFGLVASLHGIILGYSRQIFALARAGYLPASLARLHPTRRTPIRALLAGGAVGIAAIHADSLIDLHGQSLTALLVTLSVYGALTMYAVSLAALFRLRRTAPGMVRPFRAPGYPWIPGFALGAVLLCLATTIWTAPMLGAGYGAALVIGGLALRRFGPFR